MMKFKINKRIMFYLILAFLLVCPTIAQSDTEKVDQTGSGTDVAELIESGTDESKAIESGTDTGETTKGIMRFININSMFIVLIVTFLLTILCFFMLSIQIQKSEKIESRLIDMNSEIDDLHFKIDLKDNSKKQTEGIEKEFLKIHLQQKQLAGMMDNKFNDLEQALNELEKSKLESKTKIQPDQIQPDQIEPDQIEPLKEAIEKNKTKTKGVKWINFNECASYYLDLNIFVKLKEENSQFNRQFDLVKCPEGLFIKPVKRTERELFTLIKQDTAIRKLFSIVNKAQVASFTQIQYIVHPMVEKYGEGMYRVIKAGEIRLV